MRICPYAMVMSPTLMRGFLRFNCFASTLELVLRGALLTVYMGGNLLGLDPTGASWPDPQAATVPHKTKEGRKLQVLHLGWQCERPPPPKAVKAVLELVTDG